MRPKHSKAVVQEAGTHVKHVGNAKDIGNVYDYNNKNNIFFRRFPAHDELGTCRTSLVSPEHPKM